MKTQLLSFALSIVAASSHLAAAAPMCRMVNGKGMDWIGDHEYTLTTDKSFVDRAPSGTAELITLDQGEIITGGACGAGDHGSPTAGTYLAIHATEGLNGTGNGPDGKPRTVLVGWRCGYYSIRPGSEGTKPVVLTSVVVCKQ